MYFLTVIFVLFYSISVVAQDWKVLIHEPIQLEYKIPSNWYVGGLKTNGLDTAITTALNIATDYSVSMMVKVSEVDLETLKNHKTGIYTFRKQEKKPIVFETKHFEFEQQISTWEEEPQTMAIQLVARGCNGRSYILYFWGTAEELKKNERIIMTIVKSFRGLA